MNAGGIDAGIDPTYFFVHQSVPTVDYSETILNGKLTWSLSILI